MISVQADGGGVTTKQSKEPVLREIAVESRKRRASRFTMRVPVRYRVAGEAQWHAGKVENISASGALFRGDWVAELNALLDLQLAMPVAGAEGPVEMVCRGVVVRLVPEGGTEGVLLLAAKFLRCRWARA